MKTDSYLLTVPGSFRTGEVYLDLETVKVPTDGFVMANGEPLRNRWSAFMAGLAVDGELWLIERTGSEADFLATVREVMGTADSVVYGATRDFDEMILRGRFTNARRAHEPEPFYPALPAADELEWRNMGPGKVGFRAPDIPSRDISATYFGRAGKPNPDLVLIHNLRDVAELIYQFGDPDALCREWLVNVMTSDSFAREAIFGGE